MTLPVRLAARPAVQVRTDVGEHDLLAPRPHPGQVDNRIDHRRFDHR
jgi:hypothetical protein